MSDRTYRVIVRGTFADLDEAQRAALIETAADLLSATLTDEGTLIYKLPPRNFTLRCVVRQPADADDAAAVQTGLRQGSCRPGQPGNPPQHAARHRHQPRRHETRRPRR
jgi:hypothetical protein